MQDSVTQELKWSLERRSDKLYEGEEWVRGRRQPAQEEEKGVSAP